MTHVLCVCNLFYDVPAVYLALSDILLLFPTAYRTYLDHELIDAFHRQLWILRQFVKITDVVQEG